VAWSNNANGLRDLIVKLNGSVTLADASGGPTATNTAPTQNVTTTFHLNKGDYVSAIVWQTSGTSMDSWNNDHDAPVLSMNWIAP
jgi:hypothetical protein